jgi:hypothetical protein
MGRRLQAWAKGYGEILQASAACSTQEYVQAAHLSHRSRSGLGMCMRHSLSYTMGLPPVSSCHAMTAKAYVSAALPQPTSITSGARNPGVPVTCSRQRNSHEQHAETLAAYMRERRHYMLKLYVQHSAAGCLVLSDQLLTARQTKHKQTAK